MPPVLDNASAATAAIATGVSWAADQGADLAIFPEADLHGHSYDPETIAKRARSLEDPAIDVSLYDPDMPAERSMLDSAAQRP
jgi:primase-polymerase (primpol)-like protein